MSLKSHYASEGKEGSWPENKVWRHVECQLGISEQGGRGQEGLSRGLEDSQTRALSGLRAQGAASWAYPDLDHQLPVLSYRFGDFSVWFRECWLQGWKINATLQGFQNGFWKNLDYWTYSGSSLWSGFANGDKGPDPKYCFRVGDGYRMKPLSGLHVETMTYKQWHSEKLHCEGCSL